ncbi:histidine-rich glycoprotein [Molossus nigricans]
MKVFTAALFSILLITLQYFCAVSPIDCNATEPLPGKALDLINKGHLMHDGCCRSLLPTWTKQEGIANAELSRKTMHQGQQGYPRTSARDLAQAVGWKKKCRLILMQCKPTVFTLSSNFQPESTDIYYLVLDVNESDCPIQSRKHWDDWANCFWASI